MQDERRRSERTDTSWDQKDMQDYAWQQCSSQSVGVMQTAVSLDVRHTKVS
jgi:hypothetical protein